MLKAPSFDVVYDWRLLQEQKLAKSLQRTKSLQLEATKQAHLLNTSQLERFIQHYQRLTEHNLLTIPQIADAIINLNEQHQMTELFLKSR